MDDLKEITTLAKNFLVKLTKTKVVVIILALVLIVAAFYWKSPDFITNINLTFSNNKQTETKLDSVEKSQKDSHDNLYYALEFGQVIIPPKSDTLPSVIVFEIRNSGNVVVKNINIGVNLGSVKAIKYEVVGAKIVSATDNKNSSVITINVDELHPKNSLYLHIQAESPIFKKIIINADNLRVTPELEYEYYLLKKDNNDYGLFQYVFDLFALLLCVGIFLFIIFIVVESVKGFFGKTSEEAKKNK